MNYKISTIIHLLIELEKDIDLTKSFYTEFTVKNNNGYIAWDCFEFVFDIHNIINFTLGIKRNHFLDTNMSIFIDNKFSLISFFSSIKDEYSAILGNDDTSIILEYGRDMCLFIHLYDNDFIKSFEKVKKELDNV